MIAGDGSERSDYTIKIPFTADEAARFRAYLDANDKIAGRFVRTLILRAIAPGEVDAGEPVRLELGGA